jgi:hypothetical protein
MPVAGGVRIRSPTPKRTLWRGSITRPDSPHRPGAAFLCLQSTTKVSGAVHGLTRNALGVHLSTTTSRRVGVGCGCQRGPLKAVAPVVSMQRLMWPNPDRHGGRGSRQPSLAEAPAVVHMAMTLVQWARAGVISKRP